MPTCGCTCSRTGWSGRTASTSTASSACCPRSAGRPRARWTRPGPSRCSCGRGRPGGTCEVQSVDKFPRMLDYVVPAGVRVADASRVRLGAHLAEGTTVMHEGFVNFNAGTLGASMVEGRISAGRGGRRGHRRRRRRLDHGHAVRRRQGAHLGRRAVPARRELRARHLAGRRLRGRGRSLPHRGHDRDHGQRAAGQGARAERAAGADVHPAQRHRGGARRGRGRSAWGALNAQLHAAGASRWCAPREHGRPAAATTAASGRIFLPLVTVYQAARCSVDARGPCRRRAGQSPRFRRGGTPWTQGKGTGGGRARDLRDHRGPGQEADTAGPVPAGGPVIAWPARSSALPGRTGPPST